MQSTNGTNTDTIDETDFDIHTDPDANTGPESVIIADVAHSSADSFPLSRPAVHSSRTRSRYIVTVANSYDVEPSTISILYPDLSSDLLSGPESTPQEQSQSAISTLVRTRTISLPKDHESIDADALVRNERALEELISKCEEQGRVRTTIRAKVSERGGRGLAMRPSYRSRSVSPGRLPFVSNDGSQSASGVDALSLYDGSTSAGYKFSDEQSLTPLNVTRSPPKSLEPFGLRYSPDQASTTSTALRPTTKSNGCAADPTGAKSGSRFGDIVINNPVNLSSNSQQPEPAPSYDLPGGRGPWLYRIFLKVAYFSLVYGMRYFFYAVFAWFTLGIMWIILPWVLCLGALKGVWDQAVGYGSALGDNFGVRLKPAKNSGYLWWFTDPKDAWKTPSKDDGRPRQPKPNEDAQVRHGSHYYPGTSRRRSSSSILITNGTSLNNKGTDPMSAEDLAANRAEAFIKLEESANVTSSGHLSTRRVSGPARLTEMG
ncbi:hypothetical protein IAU59_004056 [Kwoniella sp. CBS 9459]